MSSYEWSPLSGGSGGVTSVNSLIGALTLVAGTGITITDNGLDEITIASTSAGDVTLTAFGSSPNANGASLSGQALTLQPASASFPGGITTGAQTLAGIKTFNAAIYAAGGLDVAATGGTDTLSIGFINADVINIGRSGATINIQGDTFYQNVTNLQVTDKLFDVNYGGSAASGADSGFNVIEDSVATAYVKTSGDRNSWLMKAPNTAGEITLTPGVSGFVIDQGSHDPVTLGTANGLSLSGQELSLALSSTSTTGALSDTDWDTFNNGAALALAATNLNTASTIVKRDANGNAFMTNLSNGLTSVSAVGGTTTLTVASNRVQILTGGASQNINLPNATTLAVGWQYELWNNSNGDLVIRNAGSTILFTLQSGAACVITCTNASTSNGVWDARFLMPPNSNYHTLTLAVTGNLTTTSTIQGTVITGTRLVSTIATGTAPLTVTSTTRVNT